MLNPVIPYVLFSCNGSLEHVHFFIGKIHRDVEAGSIGGSGPWRD